MARWEVGGGRFWAKNEEEDVSLTTPTDWTLCAYYMSISCCYMFRFISDHLQGNLCFPYSKPFAFTQQRYCVNYCKRCCKSCKICCKSDKTLSFYCWLQPTRSQYISQRSLCTIYTATCFDIFTITNKHTINTITLYITAVCLYNLHCYMFRHCPVPTTQFTANATPF